MTQKISQTPFRDERSARPPSSGSRQALLIQQFLKEDTGWDLPMSDALRTALHRRDDDFHGRRESAQERETRLKRGEPALGIVLRTPKPTTYPSAVIAEAEQLLEDLKRGFAPTSKARLHHEIDRYLDVLNASVANPQDSDALLMRKSALALALDNAPTLLWTQTLLRRAQRRFFFFPSVAALCELFDAHIAEMRRQRASLRHVIMHNDTMRAKACTTDGQDSFLRIWSQSWQTHRKSP